MAVYYWGLKLKLNYQVQAQISNAMVSVSSSSNPKNGAADIPDNLIYILAANILEILERSLRS